MNFTDPKPSLNAGEEYYIVAWANTTGDVNLHYDTLSYFNRSIYDSKNYNTSFPAGIENSYFDKDKLEKIISNLVTNAIKYTPANGTVTVSINEKKDYAKGKTPFPLAPSNIYEPNYKQLV